MRRRVRPAAWVLALFALAGCGMYGPLYLVEEEEPAAPAESPESAAPAERAEPAGVVVDPGMLPAGDRQPEGDDEDPEDDKDEEDEEDEGSPESPRTGAGPEGAS
jgi:predicted small lipoprotein YifL